ncbi:MAG: hypothetical protein ABIT76_07930 [Chthoniobacterales bacterium]
MRFPFHFKSIHLASLALLLWSGLAPAQLPKPGTPEKRGLDGIATKAWGDLSNKYFSNLGVRALTINPPAWQHAETANFIYHFRSAVAATEASVEAEFYYRVIAADLKKESATWQRKAHIFIFENEAEWAEFQKSGGLDPWTGGLQTGSELFVFRDGKARWKGRTLGHEIAHLVVSRFFPGQIPLWLNEGYAENVSRKAYAAYYRARGYASKPGGALVPRASYIPLERLMNLQSYPTDAHEVETFYGESDALVRFLVGKDDDKFLKFFGLLATGATNDSALAATYFGDFSSVAKLDEAFRKDTENDGVLARKW